ncbi:MAG TPA: ACT domain-containing protein, partial [Gemmatimonadales bacterium]
RQEEESVSSQLGREILARELKRRRLDAPSQEIMNAAAVALNLEDGAALEVSLGRGDLAIGQVMKALFPELPAEALQEKPANVFGRVMNRLRLGRGIKIQGVDGLMVRYAQCCQPVPGDQVVGYVTQGRGISIHRSDCPNLLTLSQSGRRLEIDWQEQSGETYAVRLEVAGEDRRGLYADIMQAISTTGTNIRGADLQSKDGSVHGTIFVEVDNLTHLAKVLRTIRKVKGVSTVDRREAASGERKA